MLCVIEIRQVRKVVNPNPLDRFIIFVGSYNFSDLSFSSQGSGFDLIVTVHTDINGRNGGILSLGYADVTILTVNFILTSVNFVRKSDGLFRGISLLNTDRKQTVDHGFKTQR